MTKEQIKVLFYLSLSVFFSLTLWLSTSVVSYDLLKIWSVDKHLESWLSALIPIGFAVGTFLISYFGIADRYHPRKIFVTFAIFGATINLFILFVTSSFFGFLLIFLTGFSLSGVYPIAIKILSQWFPKQKSFAMGILIAALTLGTSFPHVINLLFSNVHWQIVIIASSSLTYFASIIVGLFLKDCKYTNETGNFSFLSLKSVIKNKPVMYANYGYFGHMWELYAMWVWLPIFLTHVFSFHFASVNTWTISLLSFIFIGIAGAIGCFFGGILSEKIGKERFIILSLLISGFCSILIGLTYQFSLIFTLLIAFVWGVFVVSDSAQFSASVSYSSKEEYVGTALTFQMCIGFLVTVVSINLVPIVQENVGWTWTFSILSLGPLLGIISILKLSLFKKRMFS